MVKATDLSPQDFAQVLKAAFSDPDNALRTIGSEGFGPGAYEDVQFTLDVDKDILQIDLLESTVNEVSTLACRADSASNLQSTFFKLNTSRDAIEYYVWYNIAAGGTDPIGTYVAELTGKTGIEITTVAANDTATIVAAATELTIAKTVSNGGAGEYFTISRTNDLITIEPTTPGPVNVDSSGNGILDGTGAASGHTLATTQQGSQKIKKSIVFTLDGDKDITRITKI